MIKRHITLLSLYYSLMHSLHVLGLRVVLGTHTSAHDGLWPKIR